MAKATTRVVLTSAWVKIADSGITFSFNVRSGAALLNYSAASPALDDGELFERGDHCGDTSPTQNAWMRANPGYSLDAVVIILHKE